MQQQNNKILITGGASGIGFGMAERFIKENNTVIICERRKEALEDAAAKLPGVITWQCDSNYMTGLNTDLGGKGIHDAFPPVSDFIEAIFDQLKEGKTQLTFGFSETVSKAGQGMLQPIFARLNQ